MRPFVENIGAAFSGGVLLQKGHRNTLRTFTVHGTEFVVKQFGKPNPFNRIVYSLIRKPKGLRAYEYAFRIQAAGFDTPTPVAYVEKGTWGLSATAISLARAARTGGGSTNSATPTPKNAAP